MRLPGGNGRFGNHPLLKVGILMMTLALGFACVVVVVALLGVGCWKREGQLLPDWDRIWMIRREINVAFDSDARNKYQVALQRQRLAAMLERRAGYAG